jgi:TrmH family RNA methyltransferase
MKIISSRQNEEIIQASLLKQTKHRTQQQRFIAEGMRTCLTLIESGMHLVMLYATREGYDQIAHYALKVPMTLVGAPVIEKLSSASTPSGIVGVFAIPQPPAIQKLNSGIVLAGLIDPGNIGTLIRTCAAFGLRTVVTIDGADIWGPKVIQASAGAIGHVSIFNESWSTLLAKKSSSVSLAALVPSHGQPLHTIPNQQAMLLIIGSEAHGIPEEWLSSCDIQVTIPMASTTESLNAGVAGSIALYELFGKKN